MDINDIKARAQGIITELLRSGASITAHQAQALGERATEKLDQLGRMVEANEPGIEDAAATILQQSAIELGIAAVQTGDAIDAAKRRAIADALILAGQSIGVLINRAT